MRETDSGATVLGEHINADGSVAPTLVRTYAGQDGLAHLPQIVEAYERLSTSDNPRDRAAGIEGLSMLRNATIDRVTVSYVQRVTLEANRVYARRDFDVGDICSVAIHARAANGFLQKLSTTWTMESVPIGQRSAPARSDDLSTPQTGNSHIYSGPALTCQEREMAVRSATRPVVFFSNGLGDHLLTRPTVLALQRYYQGRLGFIGASGMASTFFPDANFRVLHEIPVTTAADGHSPRFNPDDIGAIASEFDALISLNPWCSQDMKDLEKQIRPKPFLGLAPDHGNLPPLARATHYVDYAFGVARLVDPTCRLDDVLSLPPTPDLNRHRAEHIRKLLPPGYKILCVNTSTRDPRKQWPGESFRTLLRQFLIRRSDYIAVIVDDVDADLDCGDLEARICSLDGVDLETSTALVASADLFLGVDSYFLHVADFAKIPSVGVFGPTDPRLWGFRFTRHKHVSANTMNEISVEQVGTALDALLEELQGL